MDDVGPPIFHRRDVKPLIWIDIMGPKPSLESVPNSCGEPALEEEVSSRLLNLVAKLAKSAILPTPPFKPIRRPHMVLEN